PRRDSFVDDPESVSVTVGDQGPVRATAVVAATYRWPDHVDGSSQARVGDHPVLVVTTIEVRADEAAVRVHTAFVNPSRDHRLRVHFPLPEPATGSEAECAFATVRRGLTAEGRADEYGLPTFPSRRFVRAGGLTVVHDGVAEYELVDLTGPDGAAVPTGAAVPDGTTAGTLAVTLLRSTGMLSRLGMAYRPFPAGPLTPVDGLQLAGQRIEARYAIALNSGAVDTDALGGGPLDGNTLDGGALDGAAGGVLSGALAVASTRGRWPTTCCCPSRSPGRSAAGGGRRRAPRWR